MLIKIPQALQNSDYITKDRDSQVSNPVEQSDTTLYVPSGKKLLLVPTHIKSNEFLFESYQISPRKLLFSRLSDNYLTYILKLDCASNFRNCGNI